MDSLIQDLRYAARTLAGRPAFTLVAVLSLALGIGATVGVFGLVDAYILRPLPYEDPERLVHLWRTTRQTDRGRVPLVDFLDWRERSESFAGLAAFNYTIETLTGGEVPEQISGARVSANAFRLLGVEPILGRGFRPGEDRRGDHRVALLSERFWRERHDGDPGVLGRTLEIDGEEHTIVGVMPGGFNFPLPTTVAWFPRVLDDPGLERGGAPWVQVVGRLAPGVTREQARAEMEAVAARLAERYPGSNRDVGVAFQSLRAALNFAYDVLQPMAAVLGAAVAFVLLIACANVASLLLARGTTREREIALRSALGAGRGRLVRQLLTESAVVALLGGAGGAVVGSLLVSWIDATIPAELYRVGELELDVRALGFALAASLLTTFVFGLVPALRTTRTDLAAALKEGGTGAGTGRRKLGLQGTMVAVEMTLAVVLLVGTALMIQSLSNLRSVDPGFRQEGVLTMRMLLSADRYDTAAQTAAFHRELIRRARGVPGVESAATVDYLPLNHESGGLEFTIEGRPVPERPLQTIRFIVGPGYFDVMGIPLLEGRTFDERDRLDTAPAAVVDRATAERFWPDSDPVGARIRFATGDTVATIVGVVESTRQVDLARKDEPYVYLSHLQFPGRYLRLLTRTRLEPKALTGSLREVVRDLDPSLAVTDVRTMGQVVHDFLLPQRTLVDSLGGLAGGALILAMIGTYGLMAFFVARRVREIGIRVSLGATRGDIRRMIAGRVLRLTGIAVGIGLLAAFGLMRLASSFLYGISAADPVVYAGAAIFLGGTAVVTGLIGARRATSIDPMVALRRE